MGPDATQVTSGPFRLSVPAGLLRVSAGSDTVTKVTVSALSPCFTSAVTTVRVRVTDDYLQRLLKSPRVGLRELIDNALDADAHNVTVALKRSALGAIDQVVVSDDGEGMSLEVARNAFGSLGASWKAGARHTAGGRQRRGSKGSGRWAAFSIGRDVTWVSTSHPIVALDESRDTGRLDVVTVRGSVRTPGQFEIEPADPVALRGRREPGTVVTVTDVAEKAQSIDGHAENLTRHYATELRRQPRLNLVFDGQPLDVNSVILETHQVPVTLDPDVSGADSVAEGSVTLTVVDWDKDVKWTGPAMVLTDSAGHGLFDHRDGVTRASWPFTAYLAWDGFTPEQVNLPYPVAHSDSVTAVLDAGLAALREHVRLRQDQARIRLVEQWKAEGVYPYEGTAHGVIEEAERELFEYVAVTAAPAIQASDVSGRKLSLRLLREAVTQNPSQLSFILTEVLALNDDQIAELHQLLQRTSLPSLITAAGVVTHRLDIITGLRQLLHDPDDARDVKERRHLHEIVAAEPWLFGDEYTTAVSDRSLDEVLRAHRRILGDERVLFDSTSDEPVLVSGKRGRVDLMLTRVHPTSATGRQHLVVELKRPGLPLGAEEFSQLEKYAFEIRKDSRFHGQNVLWDFVLIGTRFDEFGADKARGLDGSRRDNFRIRAMTWDDLLHNRLQQLKFVQDALKAATNEGTGLAELRRIHGDYLPEQPFQPDPAADG